MPSPPADRADRMGWSSSYPRQPRPGTDWVSGAYYEKQKVAKTSEQAYDDRLAERFWELSAEMVGLASLTSN